MLTRYNIVGICVTVLIILLFPAAVMAEPVITGEAGLVMDMKNGQILYGKNIDKPRMYPASTTKILTALIAIKYSSLDEMVSVSSRAVMPGGSAIGLQPGEQLLLRDLLYAVMLSSANDGAAAVAEHIGGSIEGFAELMNSEARSLGAKNSHFTNPHGMPDPEHYTTARDLAVIARAAMQNPEFKKIAGTYHYRIKRNLPQPVNGIPQEDFVNHNKMIWPGSVFRYQGATGIKTGYTVDAGQCMVVSARRDERELLAVVLKSQGYNIYHDARALLDYGFSTFVPVEAVKAGETVARADVAGGKEEYVPAVTERGFYYNFPASEKADITRRVELKEDLRAPVYREDRIGRLVFMNGDREIGRVNLVAAHAVEKRSLLRWVYFPPVLVLILAVVFLWVRKRARRRRIVRRSRFNGIIR